MLLANMAVKGRLVEEIQLTLVASESSISDAVVRHVKAGRKSKEDGKRTDS